MTTFYNFTLKIETSWVEEAHFVNPFWNDNGVIEYVSFIYSQIKLKICNVRNNNPNAQNLQQKTKTIQIESKIESTTSSTLALSI